MPLLLLLAAGQLAALVVLVARLLPGRRRLPPVPPVLGGGRLGCVSVVLATLDEAHRVGPCLEGLHRQGPELAEVLVVDSDSTDGTRELVAAMAARDPRFRLLSDGPLPDGWVGKVWALETGLRQARAEWVLGVDADIEPLPGMVAGAVRAAERARFDVASFAPRFRVRSLAEQWLQPALLTTLLYRCGAAGDGTAPPARLMANGQCFLARRAVLERHGGYAPARASFSDDVTLARHLARRGVRVGFLDGSRLYVVRMYTSAAETWREWGRSLDLSDSSTSARQWGDVALLTLAQALPLPTLLVLGVAALLGAWGDAAGPLLAVNALLVAVRALCGVALRASYESVRWAYWLSPFADPLAVLRIVLSTVRRPTRWRGRTYAFEGEG
jgi:dolichol-phosphate mannosyltransferase